MDPTAKQSPRSRRPLKTRGTRWARATAQGLTAAGVRPNAVSVFSVFLAAGAGFAFWASAHVEALPPALWLLLAALLIQGRLLCNLLDGMIAVEGGYKTKSGEVYNEFPDRIADLLIIGGAGYVVGALPRQPELAWLTAGLAVTIAYLRALGVAAGASPMFQGPMAKPHRMALLTAAAVLQAFASLLPSTPLPLIFWALVAMAAGSVVTLIRRCRRIIAELESS